MAEYHCSHLPPCHEGCAQPRHSSVLGSVLLLTLASQKVVIIVTPCQCLLFSPTLLSSRRNYLPTSPLIAPISRPLANNEPVGQMFIVFVCNMFTFQKFGISSLHIGELHSYVRNINMPGPVSDASCPVPEIIYHVTICHRPLPPLHLLMSL